MAIERNTLMVAQNVCQTIKTNIETIYSTLRDYCNETLSSYFSNSYLGQDKDNGFDPIHNNLYWQLPFDDKYVTEEQFFSALSILLNEIDKKTIGIPFKSGELIKANEFKTFARNSYEIATALRYAIYNVLKPVRYDDSTSTYTSISLASLGPNDISPVVSLSNTAVLQNQSILSLETSFDAINYNLNENSNGFLMSSDHDYYTNYGEPWSNLLINDGKLKDYLDNATTEIVSGQYCYADEANKMLNALNAINESICYAMSCLYGNFTYGECSVTYKDGLYNAGKEKTYSVEKYSTYQTISLEKITSQDGLGWKAPPKGVQFDYWQTNVNGANYNIPAGTEILVPRDMTLTAHYSGKVKIDLNVSWDDRKITGDHDSNPYIIKTITGSTGLGAINTTATIEQLTAYHNEVNHSHNSIVCIRDLNNNNAEQRIIQYAIPYNNSWQNPGYAKEYNGLVDSVFKESTYKRNIGSKTITVNPLTIKIKNGRYNFQLIFKGKVPSDAKSQSWGTLKNLIITI